MQEYEQLKQLVEAAAEDIDKAKGGNRAAGVRVRKHMQEVKAAAQTVRNKVLELRGSD
ncbi:MAG: histone H1 [Phycisphaerae bacterium]|nr:histone H1 [Phycisphaerae bacterium]